MTTKQSQSDYQSEINEGYVVTAVDCAIEIRRYIATSDVAAEVAKFPKSLKVKSYTLYAIRGLVPDVSIISLRVRTNPNGVNGGKNESGISRVRKFLSIVDWQYKPLYGNSMTKEEFERRIA